MMLKQSDGSFACVAESPTRFTLGEVCALKVLTFCVNSLTQSLKKVTSFDICGCKQTKEELLQVLGLQEEKGSSLEFLRRGYKVFSTLI